VNSTTAIVMMGLSGTGKSTYLAALWHAFETQGIPKHLTIGTQPEDRTYLNKIKQEWLGATPVSKTHEEHHHTVQLSLTDTDRNTSLQLSIPDLPGEAYRNAWANRKLDVRIHAQLTVADGILLFIGPNPHDPPLINVYRRQLHQMGLETLPEGASDTVIRNAVPWDAKQHARTDTVLTDLLQLALELRAYKSAPLKVSVIVSAWDKQEIVNPNPARLLQHQYQLLSRFISTNSHRLQMRVFGVSAQGCDYENSQERDRALNHIEPLHRVRVVEDSSENHDLTQTLHWMMTSR
jgi:Double-GTPase 1